MLPIMDLQVLRRSCISAILEGEEIFVECESRGGKPAADIVWKHKDGADILASEVVDFITTKDDKIFKTHSMLKFIPIFAHPLVISLAPQRYQLP